MANNKTIPVCDLINAPLAKYNQAQDLMALPNALLGGTEGMRDAGVEYLPPEEGESQLKYESRLARSTLFEGYRRTIEKLVGEMVREQVAISDDVSEDVKDLLKNIDMKGNDITMFATMVARSGVHQGLVHILVEYPPSPGKTVEEHKKAGARPYWVMVKADQVIGWRNEDNGGVPKLTQVRIREYISKPDGKYGEKTVERVRLLEPGKWEVHEATKGSWAVAKDSDGQEMAGITNLDYIPIVSIPFGEPLSEMTTTPTLLPLAHLNRTHWQSSSDQRNILHYARLVTWFGKMLMTDDDDKVMFGANRLVQSQHPEGDLKAVEHNGAAIAAGRQDLEDLKTEMAMFGLSLMVGKTGTATATEKAIDKGENSSALYTWVRSFNSAIETAHKYTCKYLGIGEVKGSIKLNDDFTTILSGQDYEIIIKAFESGLLPRDLAIDELKRRGLINQEVDLVDLIAQLEDDQKKNTTLKALAGSFGPPRSGQPAPATQPVQ